MISLLNGARIVARLPTRGFFNPWLYAQGFKGLNDVGGSNPGCGTNGFTAVKSRDPVTGLGTPKLLTDFNNPRISLLATTVLHEMYLVSNAGSFLCFD